MGDAAEVGGEGGAELVGAEDPAEYGADVAAGNGSHAQRSSSPSPRVECEFLADSITLANNVLTSPRMRLECVRVG